MIKLIIVQPLLLNPGAFGCFTYRLAYFVLQCF